ncbi:pI7L [African swine fever virus]|uniref:PI7L n=1 Tax=African swine fever virus TaxID=10497 RepID=A0A8A1UDS5_ASF|nr:pI7L [African swine fever virus]
MWFIPVYRPIQGIRVLSYVIVNFGILSLVMVLLSKPSMYAPVQRPPAIGTVPGYDNHITPKKRGNSICAQRFIIYHTPHIFYFFSPWYYSQVFMSCLLRCFPNYDNI